jgi:hypothetical protein
MNYIQRYFNLPLAIVFSESKGRLYPGFDSYWGEERYSAIPLIYG